MPIAAIKSVWKFLRSPITLWAVLAVAVIYAGWRGYSAIYDRGVAVCEARSAKALAESIVRAQEQAREIALQDAEILHAGTAERQRIRNVYRDREIEIVKYLPDCGGCVIAPDGIRLLNDALSNAATTSADPGSESGTLPRPTVPDQGGSTRRGIHDFDRRGRQVL